MWERAPTDAANQVSLVEGVLRNLSLATSKTVSHKSVYLSPLVYRDTGLADISQLIIISDAIKGGYVRMNERNNNVTFDFSKVVIDSVRSVTLSLRKDGGTTHLVPCLDPFLNPFTADQKGSVRLDGPQTTVLVADFNKGLFTSVELDPKFDSAFYERRLKDPNQLRQLEEVDTLFEKRVLERIQEPVIHAADQKLRKLGLIAKDNASLLGNYRLFYPQIERTLESRIFLVEAGLDRFRILFAIPSRELIVENPCFFDADRAAGEVILGLNMNRSTDRLKIAFARINPSTQELEFNTCNTPAAEFDANCNLSSLGRRRRWFLHEIESLVFIILDSIGKFHFTTIELPENFILAFDNYGEMIKAIKTTEKETAPCETKMLYGPAGQIKDILEKYAEVVRKRNTIYFPKKESLRTVSTPAPAPKPADVVTEAPKPERTLNEILKGFYELPFDWTHKCRVGILGKALVRVYLDVFETRIEIFGLEGYTLGNNDKLMITVNTEEFALNASIKRWNPIKGNFERAVCPELDRSFADYDRITSLLNFIEPQKRVVKSNQWAKQKNAEWLRDYEERKKWIPSPPPIFTSTGLIPKEVLTEEKKQQGFKSKFERKAAMKKQKKKAKR